MKAALRGIERSITNLLARAVVTGLNTASKCQMLTIDLLAGEPKENVEHLEPYGFTSAPQNGAEGFALFPDGDRSHGVILMVADRRYRIKGLKAGEVAIYTDEGDSITLKRGNTIEVQTKSWIVNSENCTLNATQKITLNSPLVEATKDMKAGGDMSDKKSSMQELRDTYNDHDHEYDDGTTDNPNQQM
ncbi:phage baseplate assembly protein [Salmonella enterica]|nr:phage baseplate assembly protein [Salmonella enterica]